MTNKQHPAQFDWATELLDAEGHVTLSAQEAHEIGARLRSMGEKLKAYEDLDEAASDVQLLRMGYAAARLEIESLQARIKTMAEEHADELMLAHLDGRMRAAQPAHQQEPDEIRSYAAARAWIASAAHAPADSVLEDAARLDWLELAGPVSICVVIDRPHDGEVEVATDDVTGYGKTLREAIDAAMKKGGAA